MSREWKPGDVARTIAGGTIARTATNRWILLDDGHRIDLEGDSRIARPLAVIDPEDREQVRSLLAAVLNQRDPLHPDASGIADALREFANPTPLKPAEPAGLGAVVEAIYDNRFVKVAIGEHGWVRANDMTSIDAGVAGCSYRDIDAVRVLSEGVTP